MKTDLLLTQFGRDVLEGLTSYPKTLSSRYFYDEEGDKLFQQIMALDEYYLTRAETNIFETHKAEILKLMKPDETFTIVELGAGDGSKTKILLKHFQKYDQSFRYAPVDISANVLRILENNLQDEIPGLDVQGLAGDYFKVLQDFRLKHEGHTIVYFLGSNIGNFRNDKAVNFLSSVRNNLNRGDRMLIGFDLKKDPKQILAAYNDRKGITRDFNLNLLKRINRELGADFNLENFIHYPVYDPMTGECRSYLISDQEQEVTISALETSVKFTPWEPIFMETSKKYDLDEIEQLASESGFKLIKNLFDEQNLFSDSIWEAC